VLLSNIVALYTASTARFMLRELLLHEESHCVRTRSSCVFEVPQVTAGCLQPALVSRHSCCCCCSVLSKPKARRPRAYLSFDITDTLLGYLKHLFLYYFHQVKNRMRRFQQPPSLADQIQLVCYCLMLGASDGDLVQALRGRRGEVSMLHISIIIDYASHTKR
jgi:hypothetical protein